jgi:glycosyltransferase involved in cell wall biosynthesis
MRIGIDAIALSGKRTGVGNYLARLLEQLLAAHPDDQFFLYSNDEIDFPPSPNLQRRVSTPKRRGPYWQNTQLRSMVLADRLDVYWGANGLLPLGLRVPKVLTVHDMVYRFAGQTIPWHSKLGRSMFQPLAIRAATKMIAVSQATADDVAKHNGRRADLVLNPLVADYRRPSAEAIAAALRRHGLPDRFILVVGTLEPRKNLEAFVHAYSGRRASGLDLPLLAVAGGKGWLDGRIEADMQRAEQAGFIRRLGYVTDADLEALYAGCETFVLPSLYEGFGMPLLEAQLCGACVIHGRHPSMSEAAGNLGVATDTSVDALAHTLDQLAAGELPLACRLRSDIRNDAADAARQLWELLREAAAARTRGARR